MSGYLPSRLGWTDPDRFIEHFPIFSCCSLTKQHILLVSSSPRLLLLFLWVRNQGTGESLLQSNCWLGLCPHLEAWLGKNLLPGSLKLSVRFISLEAIRLRAIASCWPIAGGCPWPLEATICALSCGFQYGRLLHQASKQSLSSVSYLAKQSLLECNITREVTAHHVCHILLVGTCHSSCIYTQGEGIRQRDKPDQRLSPPALNLDRCLNILLWIPNVRNNTTEYFCIFGVFFGSSFWWTATYHPFKWI